MSSPKVGYAMGPDDASLYPVGNTGAILPGDVLSLDGAGAPYLMRIANAGTPAAVAKTGCPTAPTTDGDEEISAYNNPHAKFWLKVITGTITTAYRHKKCNLTVSATVTGLDITASTAAYAYIWDVDTVNNMALVSLDFTQSHAAV